MPLRASSTLPILGGSVGPFPVREMRSVLVSLRGGEQIILLTDDPVARIDIPHGVMQDSNYLRVRFSIENAEIFLIEKS